MFERWDFVPWFPGLLALMESESKTIPLSHSLKVYNKGLALATKVLDVSGTLPDPNLKQAEYDRTAPGVAKIAANDARGKLDSA